MLEYIDKDGQEQQIASASELARAVSDGRIQVDTMVRRSQTDPWQKAADNADCAAVSAVGSPMAAGEEVRRGKKLQRIGWLAWGAGLLIIFLGGSLAGFGAFVVDQMAGNAVAAGLVVAVVSAFASRRKPSMPLMERGKGTARAGIAFAALCAVILGYHIYDSTVQRREANAIVETMEGLVKAQERAMSSDGPVEIGTLPIEPLRSTDSSNRKLRFVAETMAAEVLRINHQYQTALESAGLSTLLTPENLLNSAGRSDAQRRLSDVDAAIEKMASDTNAHWEAIPGILKEAGLPRAEQEEFMNGMAKTLPKTRQLFADYLVTQRDFVGKASQIVEFFGSRRVQPQFVDEQFLFGTDEDVRQFNQYLSELTAVTEREVAAQKAMLESQKQATENFRGIAESQ